MNKSQAGFMLHVSDVPAVTDLNAHERVRAIGPRQFDHAFGADVKHAATSYADAALRKVNGLHLDNRLDAAGRRGKSQGCNHRIWIPPTIALLDAQVIAGHMVNNLVGAVGCRVHGFRSRRSHQYRVNRQPTSDASFASAAAVD
jgi:hypothetical protein